MNKTIYFILYILFLTNLTASDKLSDALINGKFSGDFRSYYFSKTYEHTYKDANIWVNGLYLRYKSDDFKGFSFGATGLATTVSSEDDKQDRFYYTMDSEGVRASELYLQYDFKKTQFKLGRQYIDTLIVKSNESRLVKQSFQGLSITNMDIPASKLWFAYLNRFQDRTDFEGDIGNFEKAGVGVDGTYSLYFGTQIVKNLIFQLQYAGVSENSKNSNNGYDIYIAEARYNFPYEYKPFIIGQYLTTHYEKANTKDGNSYGLVVGMQDFHGLYAYLAYDRISDEGVVDQGVGGATALHTNGHNYDAWSSTFPNTKAYKTKIEYQLDKVRLKISYALYKRKAQNNVSETNFSMHYKPRKNIELVIRQSWFKNEYAFDPGVESLLITKAIYSF